MLMECYIADKKSGAASSVSLVMDLVISAPRYNRGESIETQLSHCMLGQHIFRELLQCVPGDGVGESFNTSS